MLWSIFVCDDIVVCHARYDEDGVEGIAKSGKRSRHYA